MPVIDLDQFDYSAAGPVRVRAHAADPFAGPRGHAYIAARNLAAPRQRLDRATPERLEAVLNIVEARRKDRVQQLLEHLHRLQKKRHMARKISGNRQLFVVKARAV